LTQRVFVFLGKENGLFVFCHQTASQPGRTLLLLLARENSPARLM
jgi:hypothetical protein